MTEPHVRNFADVILTGMGSETTFIYLVRGDPAGAKEMHGLSERQRSGLACVVCDEELDHTVKRIGWFPDDIPAFVHGYCIETYRHGPGKPKDRLG